MDLAVVPNQSPGGLASGPKRRGSLVRRPRKGVAEAMNRPDGPGVLRAFADRLPDLGDQAGERRLRDKGFRPDLFVDLGLGECPGPAFEEQLEQPEGLGGKMDGPTLPEELPRFPVEDAITG